MQTSVVNFGIAKSNVRLGVPLIHIPTNRVFVPRLSADEYRPGLARHLARILPSRAPKNPSVEVIPIKGTWKTMQGKTLQPGTVQFEFDRAGKDPRFRLIVEC